MTLKSIYNSYHGPKCSYSRFWFRIQRWTTPDEAIIQRNKYHPRIDRAEKIAKLEKEISDLIEKKSKYKPGSKRYIDTQEKKNKLVRILSVYKSR